MQTLLAFVPQEWQGAVTALSTPVAWLPDWHTAMVNFAWYGDSPWEVLLKRTLVLLPLLLVLVSVWTTMLSVYTLPFRSRRGAFVTALLMSWWDVGRSALGFWTGLTRFLLVAAGWTWGLLRLAGSLFVGLIKRTVQSPLRLLDWTSRSYFKPGVPWVAFLALLFWSGIEATIFMYTLAPTMGEVLAGITGFEPNRAALGVLLWIFLFFLVVGSFACLQVLTEAMRSRRVIDIVQMAFVEFFVMFFEVIFLYRELIDAITPWVAQTTSDAVHLGLTATLLLAAFGWVGVRGMTWFLFGRFGTPAVLAVLARERIAGSDQPFREVPMAHPSPWPIAFESLKRDVDWFKRESRVLVELISVPVLQLLAAAINCIVVVILSRPAFTLPFKSLNQVMAAAPKWWTERPADEMSPVERPEPVAVGGGGLQ